MFEVIDAKLEVTEVFQERLLEAETNVELLKLSIEKWETICEYIDENDEYVDCGGWYTCALCRKYIDSDPFIDVCTGCPVLDDTGFAGCDGTPYQRYSFSGPIGLARAELEYLRGLLEKIENG